MRSIPLLPAALSLAIVAAGPAFSQAPQQAKGDSSPPPRAEERKAGGALRYTGEAPKLDGVLDDAAGAQAQPLTGFVQRQPTPGTPASRAAAPP